MDLIYEPPKRIDLGLGDPQSDFDAFEAAAGDMFCPTPQHAKLIRSLFDQARGHAARNFANDTKYLEQIWEENPWDLLQTAICITGLAGVGKSHLRRAIKRLLSGKISKLEVTGIKNLPLVACWFLNMVSGSGLKTVLGQKLEPTAKQPGKGYTNASALTLSRARTWRDGTALIFPDELQFYTRGTNSGVKVTSLLLDLMTIGPLMVYVANYSLLHTLWAQKDEDRQRLLSKRMEIQPDAEGCPYWTKFVADLIRINPEVFTFTAEQIQAPLHQWTYGRRRIAMLLFATALKFGRIKPNKKTGAKIRVDERVLERAYHSADFFIHRESTELLFNPTSPEFLKNEDLWSPFTESPEYTSILQSDGKPFEKEKATPTVESEAAAASVVSTLPAKERRSLAKTSNSFRRRTSRTPRPRVSRKGLDSSALLKNVEKFEGEALQRLK